MATFVPPAVVKQFRAVVQKGCKAEDRVRRPWICREDLLMDSGCPFYSLLRWIIHKENSHLQCRRLPFPMETRKHKRQALVLYLLSPTQFKLKKKCGLIKRWCGGAYKNRTTHKAAVMRGQLMIIRNTAKFLLLQNRTPIFAVRPA